MNSFTPIWRMTAVVALFTATTAATAEWVEWIADPSVTLEHADNLNFSAFSNDKESDSVINPAISVGRYLQIADHTRLRLTLDIDARAHNEFDDLDHTQISAVAALRHKFDVGWNAPWIRAHLLLGHLDVSEDVRDSSIYEFGVTLGKRLTRRTDASAALMYRNRDGKQDDPIVEGIGTDVFDQSRWQLQLRGNSLLTNRLLASAAISYADGDFDSACTPENVARVLEVENVRAIIADNVFGGCAYRLKGDALAFALNLTYALNRHAGISLGVEKQHGDADVLDYENTVYRAAFRYSY